MRVGFVTYVHGWYVEYIPFFLYSISKWHPNCEARIFVREALTATVRRNLDEIRSWDSFQIHEECFQTLGHASDPSNKPYYLRWLLPKESFRGLDAAFICDVDLIALPEKPTMLERRLAVCNRNNLPFANYQRDPTPGFPPRITGWHFILVDEYYKRVGEVLSELRERNVDITTLEHKYSYQNGFGERQWGQESLLYYIIRKSFGDVDLSFKFPTHHGIHLGPLRANLHKRLYAGEERMRKKFGLNIKYWVSEYGPQMANDQAIGRMALRLPDGHKVKIVMNRFIRDIGYVHV